MQLKGIAWHSKTMYNFAIMNLIVYLNSMPENRVGCMPQEKRATSLSRHYFEVYVWKCVCATTKTHLKYMLWKMKPTFQKPLPTYCRPGTGYFNVWYRQKETGRATQRVRERIRFLFVKAFVWKGLENRK